MRTNAAEPPADGPAAQDAEPDPEAFAKTIALRLLTGAPRSRHQLAEALTRRGVADEVAQRVLDRLTEVGLINDAEYARMLVRSQRESRGLARRALAVELRRKGVPDEHAQAALADVDEDDEEASARALLRKRWSATSRLDPQVRARRAVAMLARKGYPAGLASRLVRELLDSDEAQPWDSWASDGD